MAMIDYGASLKVDGKIVNTDPFMRESDLGCMVDTAHSVYEGEDFTVKIKNNFFVYAGDEDFFVCFYKTHIAIISKGEVLKYIFPKDARGTFYFGDIHFSVKRIDDTYFPSTLTRCGKYRGEHYCASVKSKRGPSLFREVTYKFIAEWNYKGKAYQCVYGYGIDADKETYDNIKYKHYEYTDKEREFLDKWY